MILSKLARVPLSLQSAISSKILLIAFLNALSKLYSFLALQNKSDLKNKT